MLAFALALALILQSPDAAPPVDVSLDESVSVATPVLARKSTKDLRYALGRDESSAVRDAVRGVLEEGRFFREVVDGPGEVVLQLELVKARVELIDNSELESRKSRVEVTGQLRWEWRRGQTLVASGTFDGMGSSEMARLGFTHVASRSHGRVDAEGRMPTEAAGREDFHAAWLDFFRNGVREAFISTYDAGSFARSP